MRYTRLSVLRASGTKPSIMLAACASARRASATAATLKAGLESVAAITGAVNTPNGTTRKIARVVGETLAAA